MIRAEKIDMLAGAAAAHYSDTLPYHNWSHAEAVIKEVDLLSKRAQLRKRRVARGALHIAAAWHDAGFHEDHAALGFETKEHYSAELAERFLADNDIDDATRSIVRIAILGTIHAADRTNINALILHRADIANIGGNYPGFLDSNIKLWREQQLHGELTWEDWKESSVGFAKFAAEESVIELPRIDEVTGTEGSYDTNALRNAQRLLEEPRPYR